MGAPPRKKILPAQVKRSNNPLRRILAPMKTATLCLFALLFFSSCGPHFQREVSSAVLALEGPAEGTSQGQSRRLTTDDWLLPGTKIATAPGSRLDLMLLPGILVELAGDTEIEITRLRFARDGDETIGPMKAREGSIRLRRGTLVVAVGQAQRRSRIFIQTPAGDLTAFDLRTFKLEVNGDRTRALVVRGRVNFKPTGGGAPVNMDAGYFAEFPSSDPAPRAAAQSDAAAQAEVRRILRVEKRLFRLQKSLGFGFQPWQR